MADEKIEYGLKETVSCPDIEITDYNLPDAPPAQRITEHQSVSNAISAAYERCAKLVESSHTAHDLHEIAATIRSWKQETTG